MRSGLFTITSSGWAGFAFAANDIITIADSQMVVGELTASEIADLAAWGVTRIELTEGSDSDPVILSLSQVAAFQSAGIEVADPVPHIRMAFDAARAFELLAGTLQIGDHGMEVLAELPATRVAPLGRGRVTTRLEAE